MSRSSSLRIALAGCSLWPGGSGDHAGLAGALAARGARAEWVPWDDPHAAWSEYDLVLLRETWDYPPRLAAFLGWVDSVAAVAPVVNAPPVVHWNHHKGYLSQLAAAGIPVVPTTVVTPDAGDPEAALLTSGVPTVVVKPAVGIAGNDAERGPAGAPAIASHLRALLVDGDVLVQPYLKAVETSGETSVVVLGGRVSHAVTKLPSEGEFRIHEHRGGSFARVEPSARAVEVALGACEAARALTGDDLLYARADLVAGDDGHPLLMELELIEPSLYLHVVPEAVEDFADLVIDAAAP